MRPKPLDDPAIQLVEAPSDMGTAVVVSPSSDDRIDRIDQLTHSQRHMPLRQVPDLIFELVDRLLRGNCIEIRSVQRGFDPIAGQFEPAFPTLDFKSKKLEALRDVHNPGLLPVERHTELCENLCCSDQAFFASARVRQVTTQSSAHRVSWYPCCLISLSKGVSRILLSSGEMTPPCGVPRGISNRWPFSS